MPISKKKKQILEKVKKGTVYSFDDAVKLLKELPRAKFKESVDISVNLGVDPRKSDQVVRCSTPLPHGSGKNVRVAVFAQGPKAEAAKAAGADIVGMADLADSIKAGKMDFDVVIASPDAMGVVGRLGQILGPRGLMPNPKVGTVDPDPANAVKKAKSGQAIVRTDKNGIIHCAIGNIEFEDNAILGNLKAVVADLKKSKPSSSKGVYLKKITLSTTMGPGLVVDLSTIEE